MRTWNSISPPKKKEIGTEKDPEPTKEINVDPATVLN